LAESFENRAELTDYHQLVATLRKVPQLQFKMTRLQALISSLFFSTLAAPAIAQTTERVSVATNGTESNRISESCAISADGNIVAFESRANNLVPNDTNGVMDIFVHDRRTGETTRVSIDTNGLEADGKSQNPSITADGRFIAFQTTATNLVRPDLNVKDDILIHDRVFRRTFRASVTPTGQSSFHCVTPVISANGRYVAFQSDSDEFTPNDTNIAADIFVYDSWRNTTLQASVNGNDEGSGPQRPNRHPAISANGRFVAFTSSATNFHSGSTGQESIFVKDLATGILHLASQSSGGLVGGLHSAMAALSADGRYVAYESTSSELVADDNNSQRDIFRHDLVTGETIRVSISSDGEEGNWSSFRPSLSADGRFVAFTSQATNLVSWDDNDEVDIYVHDCLNETTTAVSVGVNGLADLNSNYPMISADGAEVVFWSEATNLIDTDFNNKSDIYVIASGQQTRTNQALLVGNYYASVGDVIPLQWYNAPPDQAWWLAWSPNLDGSTVLNWDFDLGAPYTLLGNGLNSSTGTGAFTTAILPAAASGWVLYFELGCRDLNTGLMSDSTVHTVTVL
jgi:Tol biopolymer transport system component